MNLDPPFIPHTKCNIKWIKDLYTRAKTITFLDKNIELNIYTTSGEPVNCHSSQLIHINYTEGRIGVNYTIAVMSGNTSEEGRPRDF